jgi:hypothetical protein
MRLTTPVRRWLICLVFWSVFALSVAFDSRFPWLDTIWVFALCLAVLATLVNFILHWISSDAAGMIDRGYPRWFIRFALDEPEGKADELASRSKALRQSRM